MSAMTVATAAEMFLLRADGRRSFGTVSRAIIEVLNRVDSELRVRDIHQQVERLLGGPVSRSSIKNYLHKRSRGHQPLFETLGRGRYRLTG